MAIVEMSKIKLIGLSYHKEKILNTLHKTGCVELIATSEIDDTVSVVDVDKKDELISKYDRSRSAVEFITEQIEKSREKEYYPVNVETALKNFFVPYDEFMSASGNEMELLYLIDKIEDYQNRLLNNRSKKIKLNNTAVQLEPYKDMQEKFSDFTDTKTTRSFLGTVKAENLLLFKDFISGLKYTVLNVLVDAPLSVINVVSFNEEAAEVSVKLSEMGFTACPFDFDCTVAAKLKELEADQKYCDEYDETITKKTCGRAENLRNLKILSDYYKFQIEKFEDSEKFRCTSKTFVLEGYLPKEKEVEVKNSLYDVTNAVFIEFSAPEKDENPPTLLKNNPIIRQTEFVTDMYSVPNYREADPNKVVFFFFMLFMGIIMADVGYGVLMIALGLTLARRIKVDNGTRRLWYVIAMGGIFTIIFGVLFNSFFGVKLPYTSILPDPIPTATSGMDNLMTVLLLCLGLGVFQITVGYFMKAVNCFKNKDVSGGLFDGLVWVLFFVGLVLAGFNFIFDYLMSDTYVMNSALRAFFAAAQTPGLIMLIGAVVIAAVTAGRNEKGFGKFTKGFGAVYGLINLMSDILSYARLFGLMLSGMIIASTFNNMGVSLIQGGIIGWVLGPVVIVVGHIFNIAMGVLGAYIHDSRLQYIEFFGKFYSGEGESFRPIGSKFDYIYLTK